MSNPSINNQRPDLDRRERVEEFVDRFYDRLLGDPDLAPIFLDVAQIDLAVHLPHIKDYWCKLLLGETGYQRHTMNIHRQLNRKRPLQAEDFARWLALFTRTVDDFYVGEKAARAKRVAATIADNMRKNL